MYRSTVCRFQNCGQSLLQQPGCHLARRLCQGEPWVSLAMKTSLSREAALECEQRRCFHQKLRVAQLNHAFWMCNASQKHIWVCSELLQSPIVKSHRHSAKQMKDALWRCLHTTRAHASTLGSTQANNDPRCSKHTPGPMCKHDLVQSCFQRSVNTIHTSPIVYRKRKDRKQTVSTSDDTAAEESQSVDVGSEKPDEVDYEYADIAHEYANELLERGHRPLEGHHVLVIQPIVKGESRSAHRSTWDLMLAEAVSLAKTLQDWSVNDARKITIRSLSKKYMFGQGTFQELTAQIRSRPAVTAVFLNVDRLSGLQKKSLEAEWGVPVYDRYKLVLQIFKEHASSREAKLQIALAELHFRRSHLRQEVGDLDQQGGAQRYIGGGGETLLEKKQRLLRDTEGAVQKALGKLKQKRSLLRQGRQKKHFPHVAVVGYTNAGKTSLIKALTGDSKLQPQDQPFATLDVTAHAGQLAGRMPVIYTDTVGFISNLPHQLIASFAATLEDVLCADLLIHVSDASHPDAEAQRVNVLGVLHDLGVSPDLMDHMVEVRNKVDLMQERSGAGLGDGCLQVSATQGTGLDQLKEVIEVKLLQVTDQVKCRVRIPQAGRHLSWLYKNATVQDISTIEGDPEHLTVDVVFSRSSYAIFCINFGELVVQ